jgi:probable HAF family extracellular repeat protein
MFVRAFAAGMLMSGVASAQTAYRYVEIPLLPGTVRSAALGVNNLGQTVGWCRASDNQYYGFLYDPADGSLENLGALGTSAAGYEPGAHDINDETEIVGVFGVNQAGGVRAFYWSEGSFSNISYLPRAGVVLNSAAFGINAFGEVVGINTLLCSDGFSVATAAALWADPTDPQTPPVAVIGTPYPCGIGGLAYGVNNLGGICGWVNLVVNGTTWQTAIVGSGTVPSFSPPIGNAEARDINNAGFGCGSAENRSQAGPPTGPCYWLPGGTIQRLDSIPAESIFGRAHALNNGLDIVGWAGSSRRATLWRARTSIAAIDLNTVLVNAPGGGRILTTAEDISDTGYIVGRSDEQVASARAFMLIPCAPTIVQPPSNVVACAQGPAVFTVSAPGANLSYRWQVDIGPAGGPIWCDLTDLQPGGGCLGPASQAIFQGILTPTLTISALRTADARPYRCVVTGSCGSSESSPARLTVCAIDTNCDGFVDFFDFDGFVTAFETGGPGADFNGDGFLDFFDYDEFVQAFETGC